MTGPPALPAAVAERLAVLSATLPPGVLDEVAREIRAEVARRRRALAEATFTHDSPGRLAVMLGDTQHPHLALIDRLLVRAASGEQVRAIVSMGPRMGKTRRALYLGSAWRLGRDPDCRIMLLSAAKSLGTQASRWVRDEMERDEAGYAYRPRRDVRAVDDWQIEGHTGGIFVGSLGSRIVGRGADLLLADDLFGNAQEAESEVVRESAWRALTSAMGRLEPGASAILVMSRWHTDDPVGRLLTRQPGRWEYIAVPSIAERHGFNPEQPETCLCGDPWLGEHLDPIGRAPGEALWPERFDLADLEARRLDMGSHYFAAQHQQRPQRREGGLWREEWIADRRGPALSVADVLARLRPRCVAVDPSASDSDKGDEAGIVAAGRDPLAGDFVVTHDLSGRMTPEAWARRALVAAIELEATLVYEQNLTPAFMRRTFRTAWVALQAEAARNRSLDLGYVVAPAIGSAPVPLPGFMPSLEPVRAKVGKELRAGPVAQAYEGRKAVHAGAFPLLETQLLTWRPESRDSPDRMDALVHAASWLGDGGSDVAVVEDGGGTVPTGATAATGR